MNSQRKERYNIKITEVWNHIKQFSCKDSEFKEKPALKYEKKHFILFENENFWKRKLLRDL